MQKIKITFREKKIYTSAPFKNNEFRFRDKCTNRIIQRLEVEMNVSK